MGAASLPAFSPRGEGPVNGAAFDAWRGIDSPRRRSRDARNLKTRKENRGDGTARPCCRHAHVHFPVCWKSPKAPRFWQIAKSGFRRRLAATKNAPPYLALPSSKGGALVSVGKIATCPTCPTCPTFPEGLGEIANHASALSRDRQAWTKRSRRSRTRMRTRGFEVGHVGQVGQNRAKSSFLRALPRAIGGAGGARNAQIFCLCAAIRP